MADVKGFGFRGLHGFWAGETDTELAAARAEYRHLVATDVDLDGQAKTDLADTAGRIDDELAHRSAHDRKVTS